MTSLAKAQEAISACERAIALDPTCADAFQDTGTNIRTTAPGIRQAATGDWTPVLADVVSAAAAATAEIK